MNRRQRYVPVLLASVLAAAGACGRPPVTEETPMTAPTGITRRAAVAGLFYPADKAALKKEIRGHLDQAKPPAVENLRALVVPHAGIRYSGPTAGFAYTLLRDGPVREVVILAPSHYALFEGGALPDATAFETPLGAVKVSAKARTLADRAPFRRNPPARIHRPDWWRQSPLAGDPPKTDTPHTWEHSLEVQIPFLQTALRDFSLVPVILGDTDAAKAADALLAEFPEDGNVVFIASSDLSHYHSAGEAKAIDTSTINAVLALDEAAVRKTEACGAVPVAIVVAMARRCGWKATLLDYRTSGDVSGDDSGVVGYAAIAFTGPARGGAGSLGAAERDFLLRLARNTIAAGVRGKESPVRESDVPAALREKKGCFVTLNEDGDLRGCIGHITPVMPLWRAVQDNAASAAFRDPRFSPVGEADVARLHIEISVLTVPKPLAFSSPEELLAKLRPNVDGVILAMAGRQATFLPQVWEQLAGKTEFLGHLCRKAGLAADAWREKGMSVSTYQVEAFEEPRHDGDR
ncbi:MAG: AmmeMemoRadiSam system protein B [Planctomycetota bacterium]